MPPINMVLWGMVHGVVLPTLYYRLSLAMDVSIEHPLYINDVKNVNPLISWLVVLTILKNTSQWEGLSHKWWKMQKMFQTTNQLVSIPPFTVSSPDQSRRAHPCGEKPIVLPRHARPLARTSKQPFSLTCSDANIWLWSCKLWATSIQKQPKTMNIYQDHSTAI